MFTVSNPLLAYLKSEFPQASDFRFEHFEGQPEIEYVDGSNSKVEYVPVLCWKVKGIPYRWAPDPKFKSEIKSFPFGSRRVHTFASYEHAFAKAIEAIEASINGTVEDFNSANPSKYPVINGRQTRL